MLIKCPVREHPVASLYDERQDVIRCAAAARVHALPL
jgi:hypothetical protein